MLKIGDRVSCQVKFGEPRIHGVIVEIYKTKQGVGYTPMKLFAIKWDGVEQVARGYMEAYLQKEE